MNIVEMVKYLSRNIEDEIQSISDLSETGIYRLRISFANGYSISVIDVVDSHDPEKDDLYEIALIDQFGNIAGSLLDKVDQGDDVLRNCDEKTILYYVNKVANFPKE